MPDEKKPEAPASAENPSAPEETKTESLEEVYARYDVRPAEEPQPPPRHVPTGDRAPGQSLGTPGGPGGGDAIAERLAGLEASLESDRLERKAAVEREDLNRLISTLAEKVEVTDEHLKKLIKYDLAERYQSDARFRALWDNRQKQPQALEQAIKALAPELRKTFAIRSDPQVAEDQQAMDRAMRGSATGARPEEPSVLDKIAKLPPVDFNREWEKIKSGAYG